MQWKIYKTFIWVLLEIRGGGVVWQDPFAKQFYNSKQWKKCRASFISNRVAIDGGMCEHCGKELGYIVDHIDELTPENIGDATVSLNHLNFQYLCLQCHNKKTFGEKEDKKYFFDANGVIRELPPLDYD